MTNKYKYGSVSLRLDDLANIKELSKHIGEKKLSNAQTIKLGIVALADKTKTDVERALKEKELNNAKSELRK